MLFPQLVLIGVKSMIELNIINFILIDNHKFTMKEGLTSVTGETGAGKSIVFEAIRFLSGSRASSSVIKKGKDFAEINATLNLSIFPQMKKIVEDLDLNIEDDEIFIRRKMTSQGKGSVFINGTKISVAQLKEIGELLFVIVGQHDAHLLAKADYQLSLIDDFGQLKKEKDKVLSSYKKVKLVEKSLQEAIDKQESLSSQKQLLEYQVAELEKLAPVEGDYSSLEKEFKTLSNATELSQAFLATSDALSGNKGAINAIKNGLVELSKFQDIEDVSSIMEILENSKLDLEEAANDSLLLGNQISFDQERYSLVENRMGTYYTLGKRLACKPELLHIKYEDLSEQLSQISSIDIDSIKERLNETKEVYFKHAGVLSKARVKASIKFSKKINEILLNLNMRKDSFSISIEQTGKISPKGEDLATFMLQSNAESVRSPLVTSASGGELSRITLAINTIISSTYNLKRFHMFDEIDTGVSGKTAGYIGNLLKEMAQNYPVICITHIPHVAGMAKQQLHVDKKDTKEKTITSLVELKPNDRELVIASLLFGNDFNTEQLKQAKILLAA